MQGKKSSMKFLEWNLHKDGIGVTTGDLQLMLLGILLLLSQVNDVEGIIITTSIDGLNHLRLHTYSSEPTQTLIPKSNFSSPPKNNMAPLMLADMHNMVAFLSKSDASEVEKVNGDVHLQALIDDKKVVDTEAIIQRDLHLDYVDGVECLLNAEIFKELTQMGYEKPHPKLTFYKAFFSTSMAYVVIYLPTGRKFNFSKYIFASMVRNVDSPNQPTPPYASPMPLLTTLMETCATLSQKVVELEKDKNSQALEILQLKKRLKRLERKKKSKTLELKSLRRGAAAQRVESSTDIVLGVEEDASKQGKIAAIDADEGITLVYVETDEEEVAMDAEFQGKTNLNAASKGVSVVSAPGLAEKARILDEKIAQKLHDEEVQKAAARDEQKRVDMEKALELQKQLDEKEDDIDWSTVAEQVKERQSDSVKRYQVLKKKPVSVTQARKNMIIYLKNMDGYKMDFFKGMTYDEIIPIFKREYSKVQTLFKKYKDVQETKKKRVADETLLQESFKKLRAAEVSGSKSTQEIPTDDPKEITEEDVQSMLEIVLIIRVGERFSSAEPSEDKERALWVELKRLFEPDANDVLWKLQRYMHAPLTWKLYSDCGVHHVSSTKGHDIYMLTEKDYPLSNAIMILMLSEKWQVEEDNKMARDLVMKINMEANRPRNRSI
nr:hypothetical protein [Tanacetum cinerariifolium]